jgi:hypothetical protein
MLSSSTSRRSPSSPLGIQREACQAASDALGDAYRAMTDRQVRMDAAAASYKAARDAAEHPTRAAAWAKVIDSFFFGPQVTGNPAWAMSVRDLLPTNLLTPFTDPWREAILLHQDLAALGPRAIATAERSLNSGYSGHRRDLPLLVTSLIS